MKTVLVLSSQPDFAGAVRAALSEEQYRVVPRISVEDAEPLLVHDLVSACILDADLTGVEAIWAIERMRRHNAQIPIIVFTTAVQAGWEEDAFLKGANHVLIKPVRARLLLSLLEPSASCTASPQSSVNLPAGDTALFVRPANDAAGGGRFLNAASTLDVLRGFSPILTHSLDAEAMLKQFLQFLREMLSVNRGAIFLDRPVAPTGGEIAPGDSRRLRSAAAVGIVGGLVEHFDLSLDSGIGAQVTRLGRILRRDAPEVRQNAEVQKEFELLGGQVAVPIVGRDAIIGVAVLDGRVTGEPLVNAELELIFHLLEQVGLALNNIWLHDQLAGNHEMMTAVLRELNSACIVISRELKVLHANKSARRHFTRRNDRTGVFEFSDLPPALGAKVYQVLKTGVALEPFRYQLEGAPGTVLRINLLPLNHGSTVVPVSALLVAEDLTESEQLTRLENEATRLRLLNDMAYRLVNEIGNAVVPLSTHQQLFAESYQDPDFRKSLENALDEGVKRIMRLKKQMHFLAREGGLEASAFPVAKMVEEAFQEATQQQGSRSAQLKMEKPETPLVISGDRTALKHAFAEILLNALQANPAALHVGVRLQMATGSLRTVTIEVQDHGQGFNLETARKVSEPFFTTRTTGLGLGLTVSRKIIENHHGKLEVVPSGSGVVRVSLPLAPAAA